MSILHGRTEEGPKAAGRRFHFGNTFNKGEASWPSAGPERPKVSPLTFTHLSDGVPLDSDLSRSATKTRGALLR